jgi:riboflavin biosynthesis pyrimidine reductase
MIQLWPTLVEGVDPVGLHAGYPRPAPADRPWVVVNMITSADGSAVDTAGVTSGGLGGPADKAVFAALRGIADVIVAGASTVITEDYGPSRPRSAIRALRLARGQAPTPRIAVVSASLSLDPDQRLFREASPDTRPIVLTVERADPDKRAALEAVAEVHTAGGERVDWHRALQILRTAAGAGTVLCEGGPTTIGQLVLDDLVDELCMTLAPGLVAGPGPRLSQAREATFRHLALDRVATQDDFLFLRYLRAAR